MLFLLKILKTENLFRGLSHLAEAIIRAIVESFESKELSIMALGKLGGREMTFSSDLDIVFVSESPYAMTTAERILKALTTYTDMGPLYDVDTRLRPDGSRGILVKDIEGYRNYYLRHAQNWEIQALLKARPVGGDTGLARSFMNMAKGVILHRGSKIEKGDVVEMRSRIVRELSNESGGMDVKLGPGGIEEIEFYAQFLQLKYAHKFPEILVQNTLIAVDRLYRKNLIDASVRETLRDSYNVYRRIQTFLRLNEEEVIDEHSEVTELAAKFMGYECKEDFLENLNALRDNVLAIVNAI